jgi:transposase-like protein
MSTIQCPLCEAKMIYKKYSGHSGCPPCWVCEDCPAILFEYVNHGDAERLAVELEK